MTEVVGFLDWNLAGLILETGEGTRYHLRGHPALEHLLISATVRAKGIARDGVLWVDEVEEVENDDEATA